MRPTLLIPLSLLVAFAATTPLDAQKRAVGRDWYEDTQHGYRFRYPLEWAPTPTQSFELKAGLLAQFDSDPVSTRVGDTQSYSVPLSLFVIRLDQPKAVTVDEESGDGALKGRLKDKEKKRKSIREALKSTLRGARDLGDPAYAKEETIHKIPVQHEIYTYYDGQIDRIADAWAFRLDDFDILLLFVLPEEHHKKWAKTVRSSAKTFEKIERKVASYAGLSGYERALARAQSEAERTPGWRIVEFPSKRFILKTSIKADSKGKRFIKKMVDRIENSRNLFERDFPPETPIDHVSVVRLCSTMEEFHKYGNTGGGVAGWFNPGTKELVLVDFKNYDRNLTYGVATHEAFHQYCHFLFDESEAHRWFDEGHGDYFAAFEFRGKRAIPHAKMKGEDRLSHIRDLIRTDRHAPVEDHINFSHAEWQSQGPGNTSCYAQSWSIIYFLRMGALGKVPGSVWEDGYADIIPNYMTTLYEGFQEAYYREVDEEEAAIDGTIRDAINEAMGNDEDEGPAKRIVTRDEKQVIWEDAIAASWGQIDIDEFEENWKTYVLKHLK